VVKTARIELRTDTEREALLKQAARLTNQTLTGFVLDAAERRAQEVVAEANTTMLPSAFFDQLLSALEQRPEANQALRKAARRRRRLIAQK
jgi:uncharacterized protein (DUF1778 family)